MTRALVLGGGGVAGIAWELGLLLGLRDSGVDVTQADRLIGTSAGAAVAAQVTSGVALEELFARQQSPELRETEIAVDFDLDRILQELGVAFADAEPGTPSGRIVGEYALRAETVPEQVRRRVIEARLPAHAWPDRDLRITALDAATGDLRVFTGADGVELVDAVAASCAVPGVWPPVTIDGRRYIDGGARSSSNMDLAVGCDPVLVIAPMPDLPTAPPELAAARAELERTARTLIIRPDQAALAAIGNNPLDPAVAAPAARAGRAQAMSHVDEVKAVWVR